MAGKEIAVKKYVVRLSAEERAQLDELIRKGKRSAQLLTKARILLKADVSERGEGWSDSRIAAALDTSIASIERTRRQLVEEESHSRAEQQEDPPERVDLAPHHVVEPEDRADHHDGRAEHHDQHGDKNRRQPRYVRPVDRDCHDQTGQKGGRCDVRETDDQAHEQSP